MVTFIKKQNVNYVSAGNTATISDVDKYLKDRLNELSLLAQGGDPWVFGACSTFIEMMAFRVYYNPTNPAAVSHRTYVKFCDEYLYPRRKRTTISFSDGTIVKFNEQIYAILRCGVVHTFSMNPTPRDPNQARPYSLFLGHLKNFQGNKSFHLKKVKIDKSDGSCKENAILVLAECFVDDLKACTSKIINKAKKNNTLRTSILQSFKTHPPCGWNLYFKV